MNNLGKYIHDIRTAKNLSTRKLAELAQISHTEIHRIENGERKNPSLSVLKSISLALSVNFTDIIRVAGYIDELPASNPAVKLSQQINFLNEKELKEVSNYIDFLLNKRKQHH